MRISIILLAASIIAGCAGTGELLKRAQTPQQVGICTVISPAEPPQQGFADLTVHASLKTHQENGIPGSQDPHGTAAYRLLVNIDGQPLSLSGDCFSEDATFRAERRPESGVGTRYRFMAHLRLKSGTHRIIVALPDDKVAAEREITLNDATDNLLEVIPSYYIDRQQSGPGSAGATNFREGISGVELSLNGKEL